MTCGEDGTVLVWDLDNTPPDAAKMEKSLKTEDKYEKYKSRFKFYNHTMRPIYKIIPQIDNARPKTMFTSIAVEHYSLDYVLDPISTINDEIANLECYHVSPKIDKKEQSQMIWLGTVDGLVIHLNFQGFAFEKSEEVASEIVEVSALTGIHDGPITEILRSPLIPEYLLVIGGHVLSIWNEGRSDRPVVTRRSNVRLTSAAWSPVRCSLFRVGRIDGTLEVWDFLLRSDSPILEQSFSGNPLTACADYPFRMPDGRRVIAVADYRSALHLFHTPVQFQDSGEIDVKEMRGLLDREKSIRERYEDWNDKHFRLVEKVGEEVFTQKQDNRAKFEQEVKKKIKPSVSGVMDEEKMLGILLKKKNINKNELVVKQKPLLVLQQMAEEKKEKIKRKMMQNQEEFDKVVAMLLPEETISSIDDQAFDQTLREQVLEEIKQPMQEWQNFDKLSENPKKRSFDHRKVLKEGSQRRQIIDISLNPKDWRQERFSKTSEIVSTLDN